MLSYYISKLLDNGIVYSIDNIRLHFNLVNEDNYRRFCMFMDQMHFSGYDDYENNIKVQHFQNDHSFKFANMFTFKHIDDRSFSVGFGFNDKHDMYKGFLDFNPNKIGDWDFFRKFYIQLKNYGYDFTVKRFDLAVDIPVIRERVKLIKDKRSYHYLQDRSITEYLGKRSNHNFVKVYDKRYESNLDYDLTRVEITIDPSEDITYPQVKIQAFQSTFVFDDLCSTDRVMLDLLNNVDDPFRFIQRLPQKKKARFKELLSSSYDDLQFDIKVIYELVSIVNDVYVEGDGYYDNISDCIDNPASCEIINEDLLPFCRDE